MTESVVRPMRPTDSRNVPHPPSVRLGSDGTICCEGAWTIHRMGNLERRLRSFPWPTSEDMTWEASGITALDTGGAVLLQRTIGTFRQGGRHVSLRGLRPEFEELLELIAGHREAIAPAGAPGPLSWLERIGVLTVDRFRRVPQGLSFLGESLTILGRSLVTPVTIRWQSLFRSLEVDGFHALPITGLLMFLMGMVITFQAAEQLQTFGANIFVVNLIGISLLREIGPLIVAVLVAGRSGSAYTAQIGTMKVTEELDALRAMDLSPMRVLVVPKIVGLLIAVPLLTVYADIVGVIGGMVTAQAKLGITFTEFVLRFQDSVALRHFLVGMVKAPFFAIIIAMVGCYQGFQIHGGVDSVGRHTTVSVVQSIFLVIVFDALFSIFSNWVGLGL